MRNWILNWKQAPSWRIDFIIGAESTVSIQSILHSLNNFIVCYVLGMICFNYLQQKFYLVEPTMKSLAKGSNSDAIFKLIKVLISVQQQDYE